jgi:Domain of unknown function (DUF4157)
MPFREAIDRFENAVQRAGDAVADLFETAGNAVGTAWPGSILAGATNMAGAVVKGLFGVAGGVPGGVLKIVTGAPRSGAVDIGANIAGALIVFGGKLLSLVQRILYLQSTERRLTPEEAERLRSVFGDSLSLYNVRIIDGRSGIFALSGRAFTLGNTIYMKKETRPSVLIHECVHVWQYQHLGPRYAMDALGAQLIHGNGAYDWAEEPARGRTDWCEFNLEAQAECIEDLWKQGAPENAALTSLRARLSARLSRRLSTASRK